MRLGVLGMLCVAGLVQLAHAQTKQHSWVFFKDKGPEALDYLRQPARMLGQAALARRLKHGIVVDEKDVPVSASYVQALRQQGLQVLGTSRWLNAAYVKPTGVVAWPACVRTVQTPVVRRRHLNATHGAPLYGAATSVNGMLNLQHLHSRGLLGSQVRVAVFDAGFLNVHTNSYFAHLYAQQRLVATRDFVAGGTQVYEDDSHGALVLSVLAANLSGTYVGTAPDATYLLARTENAFSETRQEELNWAQAVEWADSAGADVISSSLSYSTFDAGQGSYTYAELDGNTTLMAKVADMAVSKGMLVVNSAGNEGDDPWFRITTPCDGDSVLCVGAVDVQGQVPNFSGRGPSADGRVKPDVCTLGAGVALVSPSGQLTSGNGTSFATPAVAGLAACLMQAYPNAHPVQVLRAIQGSAQRLGTPDSLLGYGIPNAALADAWLRERVAVPSPVQAAWWAYPNPAQGGFSCVYRANDYRELTAMLVDGDGRVVRQLGQLTSNVVYYFSTAGLPTGSYYLRSGGGDSFKLVVVQ